ncbi:unnamed protein product [Fraxinus pennsylvanica]|uniref:H(+)-exporting diphosphatase n=1 Tax=Fraxinus pennsylvanica TaxID=56036 RepID=A0AAD1ZUG3_9LAMI|nr:unnamed protein product [Fraxinus pennsylvanica]
MRSPETDAGAKLVLSTESTSFYLSSGLFELSSSFFTRPGSGGDLPLVGESNSFPVNRRMNSFQSVPMDDDMEGGNLGPYQERARVFPNMRTKPYTPLTFHLMRIDVRVLFMLMLLGFGAIFYIGASSSPIIIFVFSVCTISFLLSIYLTKWVLAKDEGPPEMAQISDAIRDGAEGFFRTQYGTISKMAVLLGLVILSIYLFRHRTPQQESSGLGRSTSAFITVAAFLLGALCSVGRTAQEVVNEVRRQFIERPGIMDYKEKPDYGRCVSIVASASLREMIKPGALAIISPIVVGFVFRVLGYYTGHPLLGAKVVAAMLMFATVSGILMALFLNTAGGAWDNAKKYIETGALGGKGSDSHKAAVTGDTVGDPFKDTAGPSLHVLIKMLATITLVMAPIFL